MLYFIILIITPTAFHICNINHCNTRIYIGTDIADFYDRYIMSVNITERMKEIIIGLHIEQIFIIDDSNLILNSFS